MTLTEARSTVYKDFRDSIVGKVDGVLGSKGSSWTIDGATVYEWPTIRGWPSTSVWVARQTDTDLERTTIDDQANALRGANIVEGPLESIDPKSMFPQGAFITAPGDDQMPAFELQFTANDQHSYLSGDSGSSRRILRTATFSVRCWTRRVFGLDQVFCLAEAASGLGSRRLLGAGDSGSVVIYEGQSGPARHIGRGVSMTIAYHCEFFNRRT